MRLCRFGAPAEEAPAVLLADGTRVDARGFFAGFPLTRDWDEAFFAA